MLNSDALGQTDIAPLERVLRTRDPGGTGPAGAQCPGGLREAVPCHGGGPPGDTDRVHRSRRARDIATVRVIRSRTFL